MQKGRVLVVGAGHLAFQVHQQLVRKGYDAARVASEARPSPTEEYSIFKHYQDAFQDAGVAAASHVYIVDDHDQVNIQFFLVVSKLNPAAHLVVSLFNNSLTPHIKKSGLKLEVFNPAEVACAKFVEAAETTTKKTASVRKVVLPPERSKMRFVHSAFFMLPALFALIVGGATSFFHYHEGLSWIDAFYFSSTVITTTGFGDISLLHSDPLAKVFGSVLMLVGVSFISIVFSLIVEWLLTRRAELSLGQKQYRLRGHTVICGLGRLGYQIALELLRRGHQVLIIEHNPDNRFTDLVRSSGGKVFIADASLSRNLRQANVTEARALLSVIQNDFKNLEIGLAARTLHPAITLVLRIFDKDIAEEIRSRLQIPVALSASAVVAEHLLKKM